MEEGKLACKDCFAFKGKDAPALEYDWDAAPSLNPHQVYKPPIILKKEEESAQVDNSNVDHDMEVEDEGDVNDEWVYDDDDDDNDDDNNFIIVDGKKKKVENKTTPLQCSYEQFVSLLLELLTFHAFYRYGDPPFGHNLPQAVVDDLQLRIQQMLARVAMYCPRNTGNGWNIQKYHEHLHLPITLLFFQYAMNWDTGHGERHLKMFVKETTVTCQQHNTNVFITQLADRAQEKLVLSKAHQLRSKHTSYDAILDGRPWKIALDDSQMLLTFHQYQVIVDPPLNQMLHQMEQDH
jgi:hypothetical protein